MRVGLSWLRIVGDLVHFLCLGFRSRASLAAENLFLRTQLAFYQERKVKPRRVCGELLILAKSVIRHTQARARRLTRVAL